MSLRLDDIQGNILRGYRHLHFVAYLFYEIDAGHVEGLRELLAELTDRDPDRKPRLTIMTAAPWRDKTQVTDALNIAFTRQGLDKLEWGDRFERFPDFSQGMYERAVDYAGEDPESRARWEKGLRDEADLLFALYCHTADHREEQLHTLRECAADAGLTRVACLLAGRKEGTDSASAFGAREHFGFRDGFSQPAIEGTPYGHPERRSRGEGVLERPLTPGGRWRPVRVGEFILGHRDEDGAVPGDTDEQSPHVDGTFMVWRKLSQDVNGFTEYVEGKGIHPAKLAAKLVGRWYDGTSLVKAPWREPREQKRGKPANDFDYGTDPDGSRCPIGAHVRRANPRAGLGWRTERTHRHRIIRRGMPYSDEGGDGLAFVCFNASISRQFEQIQASWLSDGDAFGLGADRDALLGGGPPGTIRIEGGRETTLQLLDRPPRPLVTTLGGYYLFVPGMRLLRRMARGRGPGPLRPGVRTRVWGLAVLAVCPRRRRFAP
jgi:Dyp-type peroxidase family